MSNKYPDRISIEAVTECEVAPLHAALEILVEGESIGFGSEVFKKSEEISYLISELGKISYPKENMTLERVSIQTGKGKILKSSSARFKLLINKISMELMPKILGLLATQKNIEIKKIDYDFGGLETEKKHLIKDGSIKAKEQARDVCGALGVDLLGVYSMSQQWSGLVTNAPPIDFLAAPAFPAQRSKSQEPESLDFTANYKKKLTLTLKFEFKVGDFKS